MRVMNSECAGKVAVITGAARGIGRAIAEQFHAKGARLILLDCDADEMTRAVEAMRERCGAAVDALIVDVSDAAAIAALTSRIAAIEPRVDVLVNNAGIETHTPFEKITAEVFDQVISVNLRAPLLMTQALLPLFPATGGAIVNIGSIHADHAFPNSIPYACSKAGLAAQTRNLALELAPRRIRVNAVCPGYVDTPMWEQWLCMADDPAKLAEQIESLHPLGRRGLPEDIASAVLFLAGTGAAWITGSCLVADGGLTVRAHP